MDKKIVDQKQTIVSRYEFDLGDRTSSQVFNEIDELFEAWYDNRGVQVHGVSAAIAVAEKRVILLCYDMESEVFLKLKYCHDNSVKINRYYK